MAELARTQTEKIFDPAGNQIGGGHFEATAGHESEKRTATDFQHENLVLGQSMLQEDQTGNEQKIREQIANAGQPSGTMVKNALNTAGEIASNSFATAEGTLSRQRRALGQTMSESERRVANRRLGLGRALATVDARNREAGAIRNRADTVRSSSIGLRNVIEGERTGTNNFLAGQEFSRMTESNARADAQKAQRIQAAGSIAAIGLSFIPGGAFLGPMAMAASQAAARSG